MTDFRNDYLNYDALQAAATGLAARFADVCSIQSIGTSEQGRELLLLTVGTPDAREERRPACWIDGNMHASELCGTNVSLAIAEAVAKIHAGEANYGLNETQLATVKNVVFYILPRMSPDGAEVILNEGRYVRSNPRNRRQRGKKAYFRLGDVDGDGQVALLRKRDVTGEFVESAVVPGWMVPRGLNDEGPFYKIFPEGFVENWDGRNIPDPYFLDDNDVDLNRNFPYGWKPEPEQGGAGLYPLSEPESRAVVEFTANHPEIFAWSNYHCFGGVYIRPSGTVPDGKMDAGDLAIWKEISDIAEAHGKYPMVNGFEEFTYTADKPLYGDLVDYAWEQRGIYAWACELWDLFEQVGLPKKKRFVDRYNELSREEMEKVGVWDREKNKGRINRPWKAVEHPQFGAVEVGGMDVRVGLWNPPNEQLGAVCDAQIAMILRVAALAPHVAVTATTVERHGERATVEVTITNAGYLPSYVVPSKKALEHSDPIRVEVLDRSRLVDPHRAIVTVGHLEGWGRGKHAHSIFGLESRGSVSHGFARFEVHAGDASPIALSVSAPRLGTRTVHVRLDGNG